ncbi:MAG: DNA-binding protein [Candidatus Aminicenantes bacterium RBG_13_62_12]|nr:MAG: DNA-binding protein [Candidatus Aminicenantes bacterium RBG_13_62_12]
MIVVDTNIIAYLFINGKHSSSAERIFKKDPRWTAPLLWRSELRSVLVKCLRKGFFDLDEAIRISHEAEFLMSGGEYSVSSPDVLSLAAGSRISAYDAEFVALARKLGVPLVTLDKSILGAFSNTALSPEKFLSR